jgi:hypothetical protein
MSYWFLSSLSISLVSLSHHSLTKSTHSHTLTLTLVVVGSLGFKNFFPHHVRPEHDLELQLNFKDPLHKRFHSYLETFKVPYGWIFLNVTSTLSLLVHKKNLGLGPLCGLFFFFFFYFFFSDMFSLFPFFSFLSLSLSLSLFQPGELHPIGRKKR